MLMHFRIKHFDRYVGAFVIFSLVLIVAAIVFVARGQNWFERRYHYKAVFVNVHGLNPGTPVIISGVEVGSVQALGFNRQGQVEVKLAVLDPYHTYIRADSQARIESKLLGGKNFEITMGSPRQPVLLEGTVIPSQEPRELTDVLKDIDVKEPLNKVNQALDNIKSLTEKLNSREGEVFTTLQNLQFVTTQLKEGRGNIGAILQDKKMYESLNASLDSLRRSTGNVEALTRNASEISRDLPKMMENVKETVAQLPQVMGDVRKAAGDAPAITGSVKEITRDVKGITTDVKEITGDVKRTTPQLPEFVSTTQETVGEAGRLIEGVEKHWLLGGLFAKPRKEVSLDISRRESPYEKKGGDAR